MTSCMTSAALKGSPSPARTALLSSDVSGTRCRGAAACHINYNKRIINNNDKNI